jgi:hypothetical protein
MQISGLSGVLNAQTHSYINTQDSFMGDVGAVLGGMGALAKGGGFAALSDRRTKENIVEVGVDQRTALPLYEFTYKPEFGDPTITYLGVMADDVELSYPDAVYTTASGYNAVRYDLLGIDFKELV